MQVLMDRMTRGLRGAGSEQLGVIELTLEQDGPSDDSVRRILSATGDVKLIPLPESYSDGTYTAEVGQPLPTDEPALFGWDGIEAVFESVDQQDRKVLDLVLRRDAAEAFGDYTATHLGGAFAVVLDGEVVLLPVINEPIPDGQITISAGGAPGSQEMARFDETVAILVGGRLPESWQGAEVRKLLARDEAIDAVRDSGHGGGGAVEGMDLDVSHDGSRWVAVWRATLEGGVVVTIDAVSGEWLSTGVFDQAGG